MVIEKEIYSNDYLFKKFIIPYLQDIRVSEIKNYSKNVYDNYILLLYGKIYEIVNRTLIYDLQKYLDSQENNNTLKNKREEYKNLILSKNGENYVFNKYPILKEKVSLVFETMTDYFLEIINNFESERVQIQRKFVLANNVKIYEIKMSLGDLHNGKSVATIKFTDGNKLIYKPKRTENALLINKLVNYIDQKDCNIGYKTNERIICNDHTWEEIVVQKPCYTRQEVENYYYRIGIIGFVLFILNSTDMHYENIICHGEYPVIIDFETISNSFVKEYDINDNYRNPMYSIINTGLFPYVSPTAAIDVNMGGILSTSGVSDKIFEDVAKIDSEGKITYEKQAAVIEKSLNYVEYLGEEPELLNYEIKNKIVNGFKNAGAVVCNNKDTIFRIIDNFCESNDLQFRQLLRPTQVYYKFIQASLHPVSLSSEENYEEVFDILLANFRTGKHGYLRVEQEIEDMKHLNVPLFYSKYNDRNLYTKNDLIVNSNYYATSIKEGIKHKLDFLNNDLIEYQIALIEMSIFTIESDENMGKTYIISSNKKEIENDSAQIIEEFVKRLLSLEFKLSPHLSTFYIPQFFPTSNNSIKISNIDYQIYQSGGLILVLMYYGHFYNRKEYLDYAERLFLMMEYNVDITTISDLSAYTGYGSLLYISYNLYKLTGNNKHFQDFMELTDKFLLIALNKISNDSVVDMLGGVTSTLYFLLKIEDERFVKKFESKLNQAYDLLLQNRKIFENNEIGMAHGISGIVLSISEYYKRNQNSTVLDIMFSLLKKENELIQNNLCELSNSWCHGKTGILLARSIIFENVKDTVSEIQSKEINKFNYEFINSDLLEMNNLCLCHGIYGNIEILNFLKKRFNLDYHESDMFKKRFNSFKELQWIKNSDYPLEVFMLGNGGIAYVMMQEKYNVPSILSLELFDEKRDYNNEKN